MACQLLEGEGIATRTVLGTDDIASAAPVEAHKRRGVAGILYAYKAAGALAESGASLDDVARIAQRAVDATRTIGVALSPCQVPHRERTELLHRRTHQILSERGITRMIKGRSSDSSEHLAKDLPTVYRFLHSERYTV